MSQNKQARAEPEAVWMEVRPMITGLYAPQNFKPVLDMLFGSRRPFKAVFVNMESDRVPGRRVIKMFLGCTSRETADHVANVLQAILNVQIVPGAPPARKYQRKIELHMEQHFALPIISLSSPIEHNPIDVIIGTLSGIGEGAVEITSVGDPGARGGIFQYVAAKTLGTKSVEKGVEDAVFGIGAEIAVQRDMREIRRQSFWAAGKKKTSPWGDFLIKEATAKMKENQFRCNISLYGEPVLVQSLLGAFPSGTNRLRTFKTEHNEKTDSHIHMPSHGILQKVKKTLLKWSPLLALGFAYAVGLCNPQNLVDVFIRDKLWVYAFKEFVVLGIAAGLFFMSILSKSKKAIILSTDELSAIIGLPSAVGKLPVEIGTAPTTRRGLVETRDTSPYPTERKDQSPSE